MMDFVKLTLSFLLPLSFAGELGGAGIQSEVYPVQQVVTESTYVDDRPRRPLRKRMKRLKFNKLHHLKRCLNEECNYFILLSRNSPILKYDESRLMLDITNSDLPVNFPGGSLYQFGFKERKVKKNHLTSLVIPPTDVDRLNFVNYFSKEVPTIMPKYRKQNRPRLKHQNKFEQSENLQEIYRTDTSPVNSLNSKYKSSQMVDGHPGQINKRDVEKSDNEGNSQDAGSTSTSTAMAETTKQGSVSCPTQGTDSGKRGNESRMPYDWDRDSYMALGSLTFLLLVLTCAVMYTGLWKKRNTMMYPDFIDRESSSTRHKTDIKELLKIKLGKIPLRRKKLRPKLKNHRNHHRKYLELPLVEDIEGQSGSGPESEERSSDEEEIYSNGRRQTVKPSTYY